MWGWLGLEPLCECVQEFRQELGKLKYHSRSVAAAPRPVTRALTLRALRYVRPALHNSKNNPSGKIKHTRNCFRQQSTSVFKCPDGSPIRLSAAVMCAGYGDRGAPRGRWGESPGSRGCVTSHAGHSCVTVTTWAPGGWSQHWHSHTHSDGANIKCNNPSRKDPKTCIYEKFSSETFIFSLPLRNPFETL